MKQPWKIIMIIITYAVGIWTALYSGLSPFMGNTALDTKKIDRNIAKLKEYSWFKNVYENEKYRRSLFANRKVRGYLQSSIRVNRMIKSKRAQNKFIALLEKQATLRHNSKKT